MVRHDDRRLRFLPETPETDPTQTGPELYMRSVRLYQAWKAVLVCRFDAPLVHRAEEMGQRGRGWNIGEHAWTPEEEYWTPFELSDDIAGLEKWGRTEFRRRMNLALLWGTHRAPLLEDV